MKLAIMEKGSLSNLNLSADQLQQIQELCSGYRVAKLYIFGSVLTEEFQPDSDIDLLVHFEEMDVLDYADNYFELLDHLENIVQRPVDLVIAKDLSNPVMIESINESKMLIYEKEDSEVAA